MERIKTKLIIYLMLCTFASLMSTTNTVYAEREAYINKELGFTIDGPDGWLKQLGIGGSEGVVNFVKETDVLYPRLVVTIDRPGESQTVLDYTNSILQYIENYAKTRQATLQISEEPREVTINGIKGCKTVYEIVGPLNVKYVDWKFMKNNLVISVIGSSYSDTFKNYRKDFEETIESLKFLE